MSLLVPRLLGSRYPAMLRGAVDARRGLSRAAASSRTTSSIRSVVAQSVRARAGQSRMFALQAYRRDQPKTFAYQKTLPKLPVPKLPDSLAKYIKSLRPILIEQARFDDVQDPQAWVDKEIAKRQEWAEDFAGRPGSLGRRLQERLIDVHRRSPNNWLDDNYWLNIAYHSWRVPLPVNSNWWILCAHDQDIPKSVTDSRPAKGEFTNWQIRRAAVMAWRLLDFKDRLDRQELIPDSSRAGPFCMYQYTRVFGAVRIPNMPSDHILPGPDPNPERNIAVIVKDQIFTLQVRDDKGVLKSKDAIEALLWMTVKEARESQTKAAMPVGVLTGDDRDSWTKSREHLLSLSPVNRKSLTAIEDSLFVLALDDWTRIHPSAHVSSLASELKPLSPEQQPEPDPSLELDGHILNSCAGLHGHNRWFDKALSISVESNSRATVLGEHSPCDALIPSIVADYMLAEGIGKPRGPPEDFFDDDSSSSRLLHASVESSSSEDGVQSPIQRLEWVTDERIERDIEHAEQTVKAIVEDSEGLMLWYDEYGAEWIKKSAKQSPDGYIQMALQLAYRKMHGHGTPTYETASTRLFAHGRTDVIRTYSEDSQNFTEAVVAGSSKPDELYGLLSKAINSHNGFTRESSTGKGFDRHLLGLRLNMGEGESHELLKDPLFAQSQQWKLSTSGLSQGDRFFGTGFGATDPDGYGINYLAGLRVIKFGIESKRSSKETSTHKFRLALVDALRDMRTICEKGQPSESDASLKPKI